MMNNKWLEACVCQLKKLHASEFLLFLRETFIVVLPVVILLNVAILVNAYLNQLTHSPSFLLSANIISIILPIVVNIAFAGVCAAQYRLDKLITIVLSITAYFFYSGFSSQTLAILNGGQEKFFLFGSILSAYVSVLLYKKIYRIKVLNFMSDTVFVSKTLQTAIHNIIPFILVVTCLYGLGKAVDAVAIHVQHHVAVFLAHHVSVDQPLWLLVSMEVVAQLAWFLGVHGSNLAEQLVNSMHIDTINTTLQDYRSYIEAFAQIGGSGATLALITVILVTVYAQKERWVAKASLPFSVFNINEITLYGLPIVFNPIYLIPFLIVPVVNSVLAYWALQQDWYHIVQPHVSWLTPPFINVYLITGGSFIAVLWQVIVFVLDMLMYLPFVLIASKWTHVMPSSLHITQQTNFAEKKQEISEKQFIDYQLSMLQTNEQLSKLFDVLQHGELVVFYQPKCSITTGECVGAEALIRIRDKHGNIHSSEFVETLHRAGLSKVLDNKVIDLVVDQLLAWGRQHIDLPCIAINIDKPFLTDDYLVQKLVQRVQFLKTDLQIEITESSYAQDVDVLSRSVNMLRQHGITVSIDDFGTGYSSLANLIDLETDEVKLDRQFVLSLQRQRENAQQLIRSIAHMCHDLQLKVVCEGVETAYELNAVRSCGIDVVQGFLIAKPMAADAFIEWLTLNHTERSLLKHIY